MSLRENVSLRVCQKCVTQGMSTVVQNGLSWNYSTQPPQEDSKKYTLDKIRRHFQHMQARTTISNAVESKSFMI